MTTVMDEKVNMLMVDDCTALVEILEQQQLPDLSFCHRLQLRPRHMCHIRHECQIKYLAI